MWKPLTSQSSSWEVGPWLVISWWCVVAVAASWRMCYRQWVLIPRCSLCPWCDQIAQCKDLRPKTKESPCMHWASVHVVSLLVVLSNCFIVPDSSSQLSNIGTLSWWPRTNNRLAIAEYYYCPYGPEFALACLTSVTQSVLRHCLSSNRERILMGKTK